MNFVNTSEFCREADHFMKYGYYCPDPEGSAGHYEYWQEQLRRCKEGYTVGGVHITGHHYNYLNFTQIKKTVEDSPESKGARKKRATKKLAFPDFWDGDYEYFHLLDIAFHGCSKQYYDDLSLETIIHPEWLDGGHFLLIGKARRKGFSYKNAAVSANAYNTIPSSYTMLLAYTSEYLYPKGIMTMSLNNLNFYNKHTAWRKRQLIRRNDHRKAGYVEIGEDGTKVEKGYLSEIQAISLHDNPHGTRGKDATYLFMEEGGAFPNLKDSYWVARSTVEDGGIVTGVMVIFGTGGDMEKGTIDFHHMYYNPEAYNIIPVANVWDKGAENTWSCFFFPAYLNKFGYYDKDGNSKVEEAKRVEELKRSNIREHSSDPSDIGRYITENAWCGREAFLRTGDNILPAELANEWLGELESTKRFKNLGTPGELHRDKQTKEMKFYPNVNLDPIWEFPVKNRAKDGCPVIFQVPYRDESGFIPDDLYVLVHDPYDQPKTVGNSLGCCYVLKMPNNYTKPDDLIVAMYIGRPDSQDTYNDIMFNLAEYYNAKIQFESDRGNVIEYAKYNNKLHMLVEELEIIDKRNNVHFRKLGRGYGMSIGTGARKSQGLVYLRDWLKDVRSVNEDGKPIRNLNSIYDPGLLREIVMYDPDPKKNFDRVMAMVQYVYYVKDYSTRAINKKPKRKERDPNGFWNRKMYV